MRMTMCAPGALLILSLSGCVDMRTTDTSRTAVEQLLLSTAADRALRYPSFDKLKGIKVFLDATNLEATDKGYVIAALRDRVGASGGILVADVKEADAVLEVGSGALANDRSDTLIGVPSLPVPIPGMGLLQTPEIAVFKKTKQQGEAKLILQARDLKTGKQTLSTGPQAGHCYYSRWKVLFFISFKTTDIPEKRRRRLWPF